MLSAESSDQQSLLTRVIAAIMQTLLKGPAKAKHIEYKTGIPRTTLNPILHNILKPEGMVWQDNDYYWHAS